jgi:hypothetical protein
VEVAGEKAGGESSLNRPPRLKMRFVIRSETCKGETHIFTEKKWFLRMICSIDKKLRTKLLQSEDLYMPCSSTMFSIDSTCLLPRSSSQLKLN